MARIRTIKPDFFFHEGMASLSMETRLFFIGLWTQVDREGRCEDGSKRLRAQIFPYSPEVDAEKILLELAAYGHIYRYKSGGKAYIQVRNFLKHQRPHIREVPSEIPAPSSSDKIKKHNLGSAKASPRLSGPNTFVKPYPLDKGEGKGREGNGLTVAASPPEPVISKPKELTPQQRLIRYFKEAKGVNANDTEWDRKHWNGRLGKEANAVLKAFDGDVKAAGEYILIKGEEWKHLPDWGLNGIVGAAGRDPRLNGEQNEYEHGTVDPIGVAGPRRLGNFTSAGEIAGNALAELRKQAALSSREPGDLDGPRMDSPGDEPIEA